MNRAVFLDRDGVLNVDDVNYTYREEDFHIVEGVPEALRRLKAAGWVLVVITNQSGIAKGIYGRDVVPRLHEVLQKACGGVLDALYYAPLHPTVSESLARKPDSLMIERATARFNIDLAASWFLGDSRRDALAARKAGVGQVVHITGREPVPEADHHLPSLAATADLILGK
ncbi:MAG: HAD-IIIA family hydrolase [Catalinimonas sp.]